MTTLPFVQELANLVEADGSSKFFIDDGNLSAPFTKMTEALDYVFNEGPEVGYHLKRTKGVYLLGRCEDRAEAVRRKLALIARFQFDPAMIRIHPDNGGDKSWEATWVARSLSRTDWRRSWQNSTLRALCRSY